MYCIYKVAVFPLPLSGTVQHFLQNKNNASMEKMNNQS